MKVGTEARTPVEMVWRSGSDRVFTMQVAIVTGERRLELVDFLDPEPSDGKAVVDVAFCGICGTDLHAYQSGDPYNPAICGHEWTGTVSAANETVPFSEGDRVAIGIATACGDCPTCQRGDASHCEMALAGLLGVGPLAAAHGGFAPAIAVDATRLYHVDDKLTATEAAMLEPLTVAVHSVRRTDVHLGDAVVVIGGGPIGLLVMQCARAAGAGTVVLVEPQAARRELGGQLGADCLIDPSVCVLQEAINAHIGFTGADVVYECAGVPETIGTAVSLARRGGAVSLVGLSSRSSEISGAEWLLKEIKLTTSIGYLPEEFAISQALVVDGRIQLKSLHTSTVSLAQMGDAFDRLAANPEEVKILVDPHL